MEEKVSNLFDDSLPEEKDIATDIENKINAIESIADDAVETEMEGLKMPEKKTEATKKEQMVKDKPIASFDNNKIWTLAVVASVLILIASAGGMVFILLRG